MRLKSVLIVLLVLVAFGLVEGAVIARKFWAPKRLPVIEAMFMGVTVDVGTPVTGIVEEVNVGEGQHVRKGDVLFIIRPQSPLEPAGGEPLILAAQRTGIISGEVAALGTFVRPNDRLARIVDTTVDSLYVRAVLRVSPQDVSAIRPPLQAHIQAPYLGDGEPIPAAVSAVESLYDAEEGALAVRVQPLEFPANLPDLRIGMPVEVIVEIENRNELRTLVERVAKRVVPFSNAKQ